MFVGWFMAERDVGMAQLLVLLCLGVWYANFACVPFFAYQRPMLGWYAGDFVAVAGWLSRPVG